MLLTQVTSILTAYYEYITLAILLLLIMTLVVFMGVIKNLNKTKKKYQTLLRGMSNKNLEELILENAEKIKYLEEQIKEYEKQFELIDESQRKFIKNMSIKRYNAFDGIGGEQSFSIAFLDDEGNGVILTSIHGRDDARTYAKPIMDGRSKYNLSEEEKIVLSSALYKGNQMKL
jgi:hypothetical protein